MKFFGHDFFGLLDLFLITYLKSLQDCNFLHIVVIFGQSYY